MTLLVILASASSREDRAGALRSWLPVPERRFAMLSPVQIHLPLSKQSLQACLERRWSESAEVRFPPCRAALPAIRLVCRVVRLRKSLGQLPDRDRKNTTPSLGWEECLALPPQSPAVS